MVFTLQQSTHKNLKEKTEAVIRGGKVDKCSPQSLCWVAVFTLLTRGKRAGVLLVFSVMLPETCIHFSTLNRVATTLGTFYFIYYYTGCNHITLKDGRQLYRQSITWGRSLSTHHILEDLENGCQVCKYKSSSPFKIRKDILFDDWAQSQTSAVYTLS